MQLEIIVWSNNHINIGIKKNERILLEQKMMRNCRLPVRGHQQYFMYQNKGKGKSAHAQNKYKEIITFGAPLKEKKNNNNKIPRLPSD